MQPRLQTAATLSHRSILASPLTWPAPASPSPKAGYFSPPSIRSLIKHGLALAKRWLISLLVLLGLCTLYDQVIGDGPLPRLNDISHLPEVVQLAKGNTVLTQHEPFSAEITAPDGWSALAGSRTLLKAMSPQLSVWLYELQKHHRLIYKAPAGVTQAYGQSEGSTLLAAYEPWSGNLYISNAFWDLTDGEKAAILAHEYRHSQQNWPKLISHRLIQWLSRGQLRYQSTLESEAFDYERQARAALGISPLTAQLPQ